MSKSALYVYSTLAADVQYRGYAKPREDGDTVPVVENTVTIAGGANVMRRKSLETPQGVATRVTPEQLEVLESDPVFRMHKENGYIKVSETQADPETVASDMENRDASAQMQEGDFNPENPNEAQPASTPKDSSSTNKRRA